MTAHVITLVSASLPEAAARVAAAVASSYGGGAVTERVLSAGRALDLSLDLPETGTLAEALRAALPLTDVAVQPAEGRRKRLLAADMDSTIVTGETIDELAAVAGVGDEVAGITAQAMRGELDFEQALDARVGLIAGLPVTVLDEVAARLEPSPGAAAFVATMRARGAETALVSGGFDVTAQAMADRLGFHRIRANQLNAVDGRLDGTVARPVVTGEVKLTVMQERAAALGLSLDQCMAIGDGANDLPMVRAAGAGVAYRAKPALREAASLIIDHTDLRTALYFQGYDDTEIVDGL